MSVVDLKYAKDAKPPQKAKELVLSVAVHGWAWGWVLFEQGQPITRGFFRVADHEEGRPVSHARKCVAAFQGLTEIANRHRFELLVTESRERPAPSSTLIPVFAALTGCRYLEVSRNWMDELGLKRKELESWATVLLGKKPDDETLVTALGIGSWFAKHSRRMRGEL